MAPSLILPHPTSIFLIFCDFLCRMAESIRNRRSHTNRVSLLCNKSSKRRSRINQKVCPYKDCRVFNLHLPKQRTERRSRGDVTSHVKQEMQLVQSRRIGTVRGGEQICRGGGIGHTAHTQDASVALTVISCISG